MRTPPHAATSGRNDHDAVREAIVLACYAVVAPCNAARAEKRVALVIGNSAYANAAPVANATTAARALIATMAEPGVEIAKAIWNAST